MALILYVTNFPLAWIHNQSWFLMSLKTSSLSHFSTHLWFPSQRWAAIRCEIRSNPIQLVMSIFAVQISQFTMRENRNQEAVVIGVIHAWNWKSLLINSTLIVKENCRSYCLRSRESSRCAWSLCRWTHRSGDFAMCSRDSRSQHSSRPWERICEEEYVKTANKRRRRMRRKKCIFLPALQRWKVEVLVIEDQRNSSLSVIHVVLGWESRGRHFRVDSAISSAAGYG